MNFFHILPHHGNDNARHFEMLKSQRCSDGFQYSVICHYSQYIKLALTDFNKNWVFYRICMWLQLSQVLKKFTEGNGRKPAFIFYADVTKIQKTRVVQFYARVFSTCACVR